MKNRPTSITVIAWILIVSGGVSLIISTISLNNRMDQVLMARSPLPIPVQHAMTCAGLVVFIVSGIGLLKAQNWSRFLYAIWSTLRFLISLVTSPMSVALIPEIVLFAVIVFFLFRPKANQYLTGTEVTSDTERSQVTRKVIVVICLSLACSFVSTVSIVSFVSESSIITKFAIMGVFCVPGLISLFIGLAISRFQNWKRNVGIVLLSGAGISAFMVLTTICFFLSPEFKELFTENELALFSDHVTGLSCILIFSAIGVALIKNSKRQQPNKSA